jgi:hypothetical protein
VGQQVETAQFLPKDIAAKLTGELVCNASVVSGQQIGPWLAPDRVADQIFDAFFDFNVYLVLPEVWGSDSAVQALGCPGRQWRRKPAR